MGDMEKRLIVFVVLSVAIVYLFTLFSRSVPPSPSRPTTTAALSTTQPEPASPAGQPPSAATAGESTHAPTAETVTIETPLYRATFSTQGAALIRWELKQYTEAVDGHEPVVLYPPPNQSSEQSPLALVVPGEETLPFNTATYRLEGSSIELNNDHPTGRLRFVLETSGSPTADQASAHRTITVEKELIFHVETYRVDLAIRVDGITAPYQLSLGDSFGIHQGQVQPQRGFIGHLGPISLINGELVVDKSDKLPMTTVTHTGDVRWTALEGKYFVAALIPRIPAQEVAVTKHGAAGISASLVLPPGLRHELALYAGPKEYKRLSALKAGLEQTIDFGWFMFWSLSLVRVIAKPLFLLLQFLHDYTHNYGITIILVTALIKLLFVPLTHKSYTSMKAMQGLQPKMAELQKKYKDDKERFNRELFALYKTHKVNPLGGCLPMVLQIPVFVAFFNILYSTIELRHAPFFWWIRDLSSQDPYYVLPVIMGLTMLLQQKMQPTTMDPSQARIMLIMPVIFTFFFLTFPAGLVLYWLVNNILTILQQYVTMRLQQPAPSPP